MANITEDDRMKKVSFESYTDLSEIIDEVKKAFPGTDFKKIIMEGHDRWIFAIVYKQK